MITSLVHQGCEVSLHLVSEDIFVHPPPPSSEFPGEDKTLRGLVEMKCPSERTIQGVKVTLQGIQTLAFPEGPSLGLRWEEKIIMNKTVEIMDIGTHASTSHAGFGGSGSGSAFKSSKAKGKAKQLHLPNPAAVTATSSASSSAPSSPAVASPGLAPPPPFESEAAEGRGRQARPLPSRSESLAPSGLSAAAASQDASRPLASRAQSGPALRSVDADSSLSDTPSAVNGAAAGTDAAVNDTAGNEHEAEASTGAGKKRSTRATAPDVPTPYTTTRHEGLHLEKGIHGFEFAFIIPATSPPFERTKNGRVRYIVTATAIGAGRGRSNVSTWQEVFIMLHVQPDGGPTPLDVQFHDVHEALGPMSISLISASLTVGGTANLAVYHPDPPPGLSVHVIRVFLEQTIELYSSLRKAWLKLPTEKLRLWEKGFMPYKSKPGDGSDPNDAIWIALGKDVPGKPGRGAGNSPPTISPFGPPLNGSISRPQTPGEPITPAGVLTPGGSGGGYFSDSPHPKQTGYKLRSVVRLPDDNVIRPSTVRGCKTDIRVTHEIGVEVFFSRLSVLDDREKSESFGKPKVQVFSMRRAVAIPSCCCTYDTIHLPPYSLESPSNSRPTSPTPPISRKGSHADLEYWKATTSLNHTLPGAHSKRSSPSNSQPSSRPISRPGSRPGSRDPSPTRHHGHGFFSAVGRKSRNSSPERAAPVPIRKSGLHALTPSHPNSPSSSAAILGGAGHSSVPKSLPIGSPWAHSFFPARTATSHLTCNCGRTTEELSEAEQRLLEGAPTAPGAWVDTHNEGDLPPPWFLPSRVGSPVQGWHTFPDGNREGGRPRGKLAEIQTPISSPPR